MVAEAPPRPPHKAPAPTRARPPEANAFQRVLSQGLRRMRQQLTQETRAG